MVVRIIIVSALAIFGMGAESIRAEAFGLFAAFASPGFKEPVAVRHAKDGSDRVFIIERGGTVQVVDSDGNVAATPWLDISAATDTTSDGGLTGLAFHPSHSDNGRAYVKYTFNANPDGQVQLITRISEFTTDLANPGFADPDSERVVLEIPQDFNNNNGGDLHFGPDGYLYAALGDGGGGNDPCDRSQTFDPADLSDCGNHATGTSKALLGKLLRIDIDAETAPGDNNLCGAREDGSAEYTIPPDNPYADQSNRCGEIWGYGLRQPSRFSFDKQTGDIWIADQGQNAWEEVNRITDDSAGGENFGWKQCEGDHERGSTTMLCTLSPHHSPVITYRTDVASNRGVIGGYRYRGPIQSLFGRYVFGDRESGRIWLASTTDEQHWDVEEFALTGSGLTGFGEDEDGNLYVTHANGEVRTFRLHRILQDRFETPPM